MATTPDRAGYGYAPSPTHFKATHRRCLTLRARVWVFLLALRSLGQNNEGDQLTTLRTFEPLF